MQRCNPPPPKKKFLLLLKRRFTTLWPQNNKPPSYFQFQSEKGFKMFLAAKYLTPVVIISIGYGVQRFIAAKYWPPMIFFYNWKGGSKSFCRDVLNHSLIFSSQWKGGVGQNIMTVKYWKYLILNDVSYFEHLNQ